MQGGCDDQEAGVFVMAGYKYQLMQGGCDDQEAGVFVMAGIGKPNGHNELIGNARFGKCSNVVNAGFGVISTKQSQTILLSVYFDVYITFLL